MNWTRSIFGRIIKDEYVKCRKVNTVILRSRGTNTLGSIESMKDKNFIRKV